MKTKIRNSISDVLLIPLVVACFALLPAVQATDLEEGNVVEVDTVEELYAAVNDSNNAGATIKLLAAGSPYLLDPTKPNVGRLPLLPGMSIVGENKYFDHNGDGVPDPKGINPEIYADTETVIDGTRLTLNRSQGTIGLGLSNQSIRNVTVRGNRTGAGVIQIRGAASSPTDVNVSETILENGIRGIEVTNGGTNAEINLVGERNIIRHNIISPNAGFVCEDYPTAVPSGDVQGWGIRIVTSDGFGPRISAHLSHNRFYDNKVNLFIPSLGVQDGVTTVISESNIYEEAVFTCAPDSPSVISAGIFVFIRDFERPAGSHRTRIHFISQGDAIWNNWGWGGVYAEIRRDSNDVEIIDNEIDVELVGTRFVKLNEDGTFDGLQNREARTDPAQRRDLAIWGFNDSGSNLPPPQPGVFAGPTINNRITVKVKEATTSLMPTDYDRKPRPFAVFDNAPDQVEVELQLEEITYIGSKK